MRIVKKWLVLLFSVFFLTACGGNKGLAEKDAANVLVDAIFYNKQTTLFKENFSNANKTLKTIYGDENFSFTEKFAKSFTSTLSADIPEDDAKKIADAMEKVVKKQTKYKVKSIKEKKSGVYQVTYEVYGLNFIKGYKLALNNTYEEILKNQNAFQDNTQVQKEFVQAMGKNIQAGGIVKKPIEIKLDLIKKQDKWTIAKNQNTKLQNMAMALFLGVKDIQTLFNDVKNATVDITQEFQEKALQNQ